MRGFILAYVAFEFLSRFLNVNAYTTLSDDTLQAIPDPGDDFDIKTGKLLAPILRPRVPGTPGSAAVRRHFTGFFEKNLPKWTISFQNSTSKTPTTGDQDIPFVNLIVSRDPPWSSPGEASRLTLVAHYDSKITPEGFIGATDSAAPCAMLMHAARSVDAALTKKWEKMQAEGLGEGGFGGVEDDSGVQILFLDGEEAFDVWTSTDSIYGAKSLAAEMESTPHPALSTYHNQLSSIPLFLLLDLLGAKGPTVPSYFKTTHWSYQNMAKLEERLRSLSIFKSSPNHPTKRKSSRSRTNSMGKPAKRKEPLFLPETNKEASPHARWLGGLIEDDHLPFMERGVEVLHIIPMPFPSVWHTKDDDGEHLDIDTVSDWTMLVTAFVGEWLDLEGFFEVPKLANKPVEERSPSVTSKTEL